MKGLPLSKSTVERILKNPFYTGVFDWKGRTYEGDHPPLVSSELFRRTQEAFRRGNHPVQQEKRSFAYAGLIKCARCGCSITAGLHKGRYVYYRCTQARGKCQTGAIREDRLEVLLGELVQRVQVDEDTVQWVVAALKDSHRDEKAYHDQQVARLQGEISRISNRLEAAYEDKLDGVISEEMWRSKSAEWRQQRLELRAQVDSLQRSDDLYLDAGVRILELAKRAYSLWLAQPPSEKRNLLDILLLNCTLDGENLHPDCKRPFCRPAEGSLRPIWRG